jgi:catechol 2,3-dioxygenase
MHLGHVNIQVRNVEASHAWYTKVLGLHTYQLMPGRAAFLSANIESSHEIALIEVGPDAPGQAPKQVGLNHMAWMVGTLDELKLLYARLKDNAVPIRSIVDHGLSLGIYFRDPDGNGVEVSYEQPRAEWPRQERLFAPDITNLGRFPGPWDDDPAYDRKAGVLQRFAGTLPKGTLAEPGVLT